MTPLRSGWATLEEKMGFQQEVRVFIEAITIGTQPRTLASDSIKTHQLLNNILREAGLPDEEARWEYLDDPRKREVFEGIAGLKGALTGQS